MDLSAVIQELREQVKTIEKAIKILEALHNPTAARKPKTQSTRGRRAMPQTERDEVSKRMKRYWAKRRAMAEREKSWSDN